MGRKKKKEGTKLCLSGFFSHKPAGGKASEKSRWAQSVVAYESAEIWPTKIQRGWERLKAEREELLRFCRGWIQWVVVRPPVGCQFALWFLYRPLPGEGRGWQDGRLRLGHKTHALTALFLNSCGLHVWTLCRVEAFQTIFLFMSETIQHTRTALTWLIDDTCPPRTLTRLHAHMIACCQQLDRATKVSSSALWRELRDRGCAADLEGGLCGSSFPTRINEFHEENLSLRVHRSSSSPSSIVRVDLTKATFDC